LLSALGRATDSVRHLPTSEEKSSISSGGARPGKVGFFSSPLAGRDKADEASMHAAKPRHTVINDFMEGVRFQGKAGERERVLKSCF
jgi:hypothetical protein